MIREKFGFARWMVVGGSWGATLALAYAQAHPDRVSGIVLRATFLGTRAELEGAFLDALPRFYPGLSDDFLSVLPPEERGATARRLLAPHPRSRSRGAWPGGARLARHRAHPVRACAEPRPARSCRAEFVARAARRRRSWKRIISRTIASCGRTSCWRTPASSRAFPASSCRAATICCARPRPRMRWPRRGRDAEIRFVEGAGHSLYDPGVRDAVMKAIADMASKITR